MKQPNINRTGSHGSAKMRRIIPKNLTFDVVITGVRATKILAQKVVLCVLYGLTLNEDAWLTNGLNSPSLVWNDVCVYHPPKQELLLCSSETSPPPLSWVSSVEPTPPTTQSFSKIYVSLMYSTTLQIPRTHCNTRNKSFLRKE